jgi:hypothetical protein
VWRRYEYAQPRYYGSYYYGGQRSYDSGRCGHHGSD